MSLLMLAAVTISTLQFRLDAGPSAAPSGDVGEDLLPDEEPLRLPFGPEHRRRAQFIWDDFCGAPLQMKCDSGEFYFIHISLQKGMFRFCEASIAYRGPTPARNHQEWGYYTCSSREGDPAFHPFRDTTDNPAIGPKP